MILASLLLAVAIGAFLTMALSAPVSRLLFSSQHTIVCRRTVHFLAEPKFRKGVFLRDANCASFHSAASINARPLHSGAKLRRIWLTRKRIHSPTAILREDMEVKQVDIIVSQSEVMRLDSASLQSPSVASQLSFGRINHERSS